MRMLYRIGINLGDVIVDGDDIYGDGVNIAARLQSEAPPGGVLISSSVYDQVRNKLTVAFEFLGELDVKNIEEAVPAFAIRIGAAPEPQTPASLPAKPRPAPVADPRWGRDGTPSPSPRNAPDPSTRRKSAAGFFSSACPRFWSA
jgi:adenylate cyclase